MPIAVSCETEDQAKLMSEIQEVLEKAVEGIEVLSLFLTLQNINGLLPL